MNSTPISVNINGYDTYFIEAQDNIGNYLLIYIPQNAGKDIADISDSFINGHLIKQIDYQKVDGKITFMKAYY